MEVNVDLRQLFINVDQGGAPVLDLQQGNFQVYDDGERQQIVTFARGDIPFTAVIAVDASGSMSGERLRTAVDGARSFAQSMKRLDECKLLLFADRVLTETPFTNTPTILSLGLEDAKARGGTALNDSIYLSLKRLEPRTGRKVVIVLSDGIDMESVLSMERAQALARQDSVVVYWLQPQEAGFELPVAFASWWRNEDNHQRELNLLRRTVLDSGGRIDVLRNINEVPAALGRVLKDLREQYVIGYYPSKTRGTGTWHDLEVRINGRNGLKARTQRGYVEK
jgi:Ca-activated chloride channel family protein